MGGIGHTCTGSYWINAVLLFSEHMHIYTGSFFVLTRAMKVSRNKYTKVIIGTDLEITNFIKDHEKIITAHHPALPN